MSLDLFEHLRTTLEKHLPDARLGNAGALAEISNAHSFAMHLNGYRALTYAWICLACEAPDATDKHREERLECEVSFSVDDLDEGNARIPEILERLQSCEAPGNWTATIVPNDADFVRDWLKKNEVMREENEPRQRGPDWARELLFETITLRRDFDASLAMTNALLAAHTTESQLVSLGCGALEDMLKTFGEKAVDEFVPRIKTDPHLAKAMACVWISDITDPEGKIRGHWQRRIAEHDVPVAVDTTGTMHLPGPHAPF